MNSDIDAEYQAWAEARLEEQYALYYEWLKKEEAHRCPPDMPPCPTCQEREAQESP